jgi:hypothetical protein
VRVRPARRSLAADHSSSAVGSPSASPKIQWAEAALWVVKDCKHWPWVKRQYSGNAGEDGNCR